jgi:hypothetical protein
MARAALLLVTFVLAAAAGSAAAGRSGVPSLAHVVVVVLENKEAGSVTGKGDAPAIAALTRAGAALTDYHGVSHPSLPNYLALVSGSTHGITSDCSTCTVGGPSLATSLDRAGKTWKTYAEGLPSPGWTGVSAGLYAKRHDPFLYFRTIPRSEVRRNVVPLSQLSRDVAANRLPDFALVVPNLCHDMHDCSVADGDSWLGGFLPPLLRSPALKGGAVFVVFDEGDTSLGGGGHVAAFAVGPAVRPGTTDAAPLDHYSLLRTVEDALSVPPLGRSAQATPIAGIWR